MPRKLETAEEIQASWERMRIRNREAQAKWVEKNKDVHLERMREQYMKNKENKKKVEQETKKVEKEEEAKPVKRKLRK
jgi:hypothetical protein